ncbi:MAG: hypothetical protein HQK54_16690, partial [Oligoflexales bacterium]|nr:hypothetical protein [Oligoflexales bacterium]
MRLLKTKIKSILYFFPLGTLDLMDDSQLLAHAGKKVGSSRVPIALFIALNIFCMTKIHAGTANPNPMKPLISNELPGEVTRQDVQRWFKESSEKIARAVIGDQDDETNLSRYIDFMEDKDGKLDIGSIIKSGETGAKWKEHRLDKVPSFGFTDSSYWIRILIENNTRERQNFFIELAYHTHDFVELHVFREDGKYTIIKTGDHYPYYQRPIDHQNFVFPLAISNNSKILTLFRLKTGGAMLIPLKIWDTETFHSVKSRELTLFGMYYGIVVVMILYNLFLFISIRDFIYVVYSLSVTAFATFQAAINGLDFKHLWPENIYMANYSIFIFVGIFNIWMMLFTQIFLKTRIHQPILHNIISWVIYPWAFLGILFSVFGVKNHQTVITALQLVVAIIVFITGVMSMIKGYRAARFYVLAYAFFSTGAILFAFKSFGILPSNIITDYGAQIGSALEAVLLSFALGDKIRIEQNEAQRKIEELNTGLEEEVLKQTEELVNAN